MAAERVATGIGRRRVNVEPIPGADSTSTVPPWRCATWRTMLRPRPKPWPAASPRQNRSKTASWSRVSMPGPSSATETAAQSPSNPVVKVTVDPAGSESDGVGGEVHDRPTNGRFVALDGGTAIRSGVIDHLERQVPSGGSGPELDGEVIDQGSKIDGRTMRAGYPLASLGHEVIDDTRSSDRPNHGRFERLRAALRGRPPGRR